MPASTIEIGLGILSAVLAGLLLWQFKRVSDVKEQVHALEKKCEGHATKEVVKDLELKMKDLERTDALQQQTLDQLNVLFPTLKKAMEVLAKQQKK